MEISREAKGFFSMRILSNLCLEKNRIEKIGCCYYSPL